MPIMPFVITASAQNTKNATIRARRHIPLFFIATINENIAPDINTDTVMSKVTIKPIT